MADPIEPMTEERGEYEIKTEIDEAQQDLEQNLGQLKEVIRDKIDIKGYLQDKVMDYVVRGREIALDLYAQGRTLVRERPMLVVGVLGSIALIAGAVLAIRHRLDDTVTDEVKDWRDRLSAL